MTALARGQQLQVQPRALDAEGAGVAPVDRGQLHVRGALPGETVSAEVEHVSPHASPGGSRAWARTLAVLSPSPDRRSPVCPAYGACGGCPLQHLDYQRQLAWKRGLVEEALRGVPGVEELGVEPCEPSPRTLGYRNQAKYVYGLLPGDGGAPVLGAYAPRSHTLVDLAGCQLVEPAIDRVAGQLRLALQGHGVAPFDERRRTGVLRYVVLRANAAGQVLATLITARPLPGGAQLAQGLRAAAPEVVGVVESHNDRPGNALFTAEGGAGGMADRLLAGEDSLTESIAGVDVRLGPRSFLQLNRDVAARAYAGVRAFAAGQAQGAGPGGEAGRLDRVLDLYAGVGAVSFHLRDLASAITAVEENPAASAAGARAAAGAGLSHLRFQAADAAGAASQAAGADLVVLNPPRAGAAALAAAIGAGAPPAALVYLSCNPVTLARDLRALIAGGLELRRIWPLDMLPHTPHVETLVALARPQRG
jgi:23S rRNA (uracil-5-)-methyltransferase RumA